MNDYQSRTIRFKELVEIGEWKIKIYTISLNNDFDDPRYFRHVLAQLPNWLELDNGFVETTAKVGFLIIHPGREGVFALINWWVGDNMLNTNIFLTKPEAPSSFDKISGNGLLACIWELEIIHHEKLSWTENYLKALPNPNFEQYLSDVINTEI